MNKHLAIAFNGITYFALPVIVFFLITVEYTQHAPVGSLSTLSISSFLTGELIRISGLQADLSRLASLLHSSFMAVALVFAGLGMLLHFLRIHARQDAAANH